MEKFLQKKWNLKDLLPAYKGKKFERILISIESDIKILEKSKNILNAKISPKKFLELLLIYEKILEKFSILGGFAELKFSENVSDKEAVAFKTKIELFLTNLSNRLIFFSLFWKNLDDQNANRIIKDSGKYSYYLKYARKFKKHILSEKEEKIINLKDLSGVTTLNNIYNTFTNKFLFNFKGKKLTREQLGVFVKDSKANIRKAAYKELYKPYLKNKDILGEIYKSIVIDWKSESLKLRKYKEDISPRNLSNDIPDDVVNLVFDVCKKNRNLFQDYFKLKAKILKMKKLTRYDVLAPIIKTKESIPYSTSVHMVLKNFKILGSEFYERAFKILKNDHIDSEIRKNKRGGAFCAGISPNKIPYVLLNYNKKFRDVLTLAHEMGHGVHDLFSAKNTFLMFGSGLPLAETASTFSETMMYETLSTVSNAKVRKKILFFHLDDLYCTIARQIYFSMFEKEIFSKIESVNSIDGISEIYLKKLKELFGDSVLIPEQFKWEWLMIPHFYETPFYCYAYSFGNLLALAIFEKYKEEGRKVLPKYINILESGSSKNPAQVLLRNGFNIKKREFWQKGFDFVQDLLYKANDSC